MKFRIIGTERQTGESVNLVIDEPTHDAAKRRARTMDVVIEEVQPADPVRKSPSTERPELVETKPSAWPRVSHIVTNAVLFCLIAVFGLAGLASLAANAIVGVLCLIAALLTSVLWVLWEIRDAIRESADRR